MNNLISRTVYIVLLFFITVFISSCDPAYYIAINNKTNYPKEVLVFTDIDSLSLYQNVKRKDYNRGDFIGKVPVIPFSYTTVIIPPSNLLLLDYGISGDNPKFFKEFVIDGDTISIYKNLISKKGFKWVYMITE